MKFNYLIKATPFLSTLLLILFINVNNQKEYTKLRILIWNTPSLTLGNYIALATGTGFILSFIVTTYLSKLNQTTAKKSLRFKEKQEVKYEETNEYIDTDTNDNNPSYNKTLIERDFKDPSPTINANFRIIGKAEGSNEKLINNNYQYDESFEFEEQYDEQAENTESINQVKSISNDWNDESYSNW